MQQQQQTTATVSIQDLKKEIDFLKHQQQQSKTAHKKSMDKYLLKTADEWGLENAKDARRFKTTFSNAKWLQKNYPQQWNQVVKIVNSMH